MMKLADKIEHISANDVLNEGREKINKFAIDPAMRAEGNSELALSLANRADDKSKETENRLNNIIVESTDSAEIIDARGKYNLLSDRLNANDNIYVDDIESFFLNNKYFVTAFNSRDWLKMSIGMLDIEKNFVSIWDINGIDLDPVFGVREPSTRFFEGYFYIIYTLGHKEKVTGIDTSGFSWDYIPCKRTKNFIDFETYNIDCPSGYWAPQFFEIANQMYIGLSGSDGDYYTTVDLKSKKIGEIKKIKINIENVVIMDSYFLYDNNHIFIATKIEKTTNVNFNVGDIVILSSDKIDGVFEFKSIVPFRDEAEGPVIIKEKDKFYVYADIFTHKYSAVMHSDDMINWQSESIVEVTDGTRVQHFDVLDISELKDVLFTIKNKFVVKNGYKKTHPAYLTLSDYVNDGVFIRPTSNNDVIYNIYPNQHIEIKSILRNNPIDTEQVIIYFATNASDNATLKIVGETNDSIPINSIEVPNGKEVNFKSSLDSRKTIILQKLGGDFFPQGWDNSSPWRIINYYEDFIVHDYDNFLIQRGSGQLNCKYIEYRNFAEVEIFGYFTNLEGGNLGALTNSLPNNLSPKREFAIPVFTDIMYDDSNKILLMSTDGTIYCWGVANALKKDRKYSFNLNYKVYK